MNSGRTPEECRDFFAEVFAAMDAVPKPMKVAVFADGLEIDLVDGNPVFRAAGGEVAADFRRRWIAEHPVPLKFGRREVLVFSPASGNRVKVRRARFYERWFR